jgi:Lsr2
MLTGDAGQLGANTTVRFGLGGREYEIDLSARHASELRYMIGCYLSVARKIKPAPTRPRPRHQSRPPSLTDREQSRPPAPTDLGQSRRIRSWAAEQGLPTSPRGRIPRHVVDAYQATMRPAPVPSRPRATAEPAPVPSRPRATAEPAPVPSRPRATAEPAPVSRGGATGKPLGRTGTPRAAHEPGRAASVPGSGADPRSGEHALTDRERRELRVIADTAQPQRTNVAGRLRTKGLADRDSAGNWWPTDAGRRELISA